MRWFAGIFLALAFASAIGAEPLFEATLVSHTRLHGEILTKSVSIRTESGETEIPMEQVLALSLGETDIVSTGGGPAMGRLLTTSFRMRTELGEVTVLRDQLRSLRAAPPKATRDDPAAEAGSAASSSAASFDPPDRLRPAAVVRVSSTIRSLALSADGRWLYLCNSSDGEIQRIDTATRTLDSARARLGEGLTSMARSPKGGGLYALTTPPLYEKSEEHAQSRLHVLDPGTLSVKKSLILPGRGEAMVADDAGRVYLAGSFARSDSAFARDERSGTPSWGCLAVVDATRGAVIAIHSVFDHSAALAIDPDGRRLYAGRTTGSPLSVSAIALPVTAREPPSIVHRYDDRSGGRLRVSPDGRFLIGEFEVMRLARIPEQDLQRFAKVEWHSDSALDANAPWLFLATREGLTTCAWPECTDVRRWSMDGIPYSLAVDVGRDALYCAMDRDRAPAERSDWTRKYGVGDVHVYSLSFLKSLPEPGSKGGPFGEGRKEGK